MNCFMVDCRPHGKREYFEKIGEAKTRADQLAAERENRGTEALSFPTEYRVMALECMERLRPLGKTLRNAVDHYVTWLTTEQKREDSLLLGMLKTVEWIVHPSFKRAPKKSKAKPCVGLSVTSNQPPIAIAAAFVQKIPGLYHILSPLLTDAV